MKYSIALILTFVVLQLSMAQNRIEWTEDYQLQPSDYLVQPPNSGSIQTVLGNFVIGFQLSTYEMMGSRNFNRNVSCYFFKDGSYLDDGDSTITVTLLRYQQLQFDIYELTARNLRRKFFKERKRLLREGANVLYEEASAEQSALFSQIEKETDHGTDIEEIIKWELQINQELDSMSMYCKTCKPTKKKK